MRRRWLHGLAVPLALASILLAFPAAAGELTARLVADPNPVGLHVTADSVTFEGDSLVAIELTMGNYSANLLAIDAARSSFVGPDGDARQLSSVVDKGFTPNLLPGGATPCTIRAPVSVKKGDVLKVLLNYTLGAAFGSATWVWEVVEVAPSVQRTATADAGLAKPSTTPTPASLPASTGSASGDAFVGAIALVVSLAALALVGWGLWTLGSLLW